MNDKCTICGNLVTGLMVGTGNGVAHSECYEREHPPRTACTLYQVARGCGDPVLAAEIIAALVPRELAETIVERFNEALLKQWLRRCSPNKLEMENREYRLRETPNESSSVTGPHERPELKPERDGPVH